MEGNNVCLSQGWCEAKDMGIKVQDAGISFSRSTVYELLSYCYGEPETGFLDFMKDGGFFENMINGLRFHPQLRKGILEDLHTMIDEAIRIDMEALVRNYNIIVSPEKNLLYEGNYHHPFNAYEEMADIAGFYRAFGFDFNNERPDHICLELEFMRILSLKEAMALQEGNEERLEITLEAEKGFLLSHLSRWTEALHEMTEAIPFYGTLGRFLRKWIEMECDLFSIKGENLSYISRINEDNNELCLKEERDEGF